MTDINTRLKIIDENKIQLGFNDKLLNDYIEKYNIELSDRQSIEEIINKLTLELNEIDIPQPIRNERQPIKFRENIWGERIPLYKNVPVYSDNETREKAKELTDKKITLERDLNWLNISLEIAKLYSTPHLTPENESKNKDNKFEHGELSDIVKELLNSEEFKELHIDKHQTLKANQKIKILNLVNTRYPNKNFDTNSFWTKLKLKDYSKSRDKNKKD